MTQRMTAPGRKWRSTGAISLSWLRAVLLMVSCLASCARFAANRQPLSAALPGGEGAAGSLATSSGYFGISPALGSQRTADSLRTATPSAKTSVSEVLPAALPATLSPLFGGAPTYPLQAEPGATALTPTLSARFPSGKPFSATSITPLPGAQSVTTPTLSPYLVTKTPFPTRTPQPTVETLPVNTQAQAGSGPTSTGITTTAAAPAAITLTGYVTSTGSASAPSDLSPYRLASIYSDTVATGWTITHSWGVSADLASQDFVHHGANAIAVTPQQDFGTLFFSVQDGAPQTYPYETTLGLSFWINSGEQTLYLDQLAVTILGSNAFTYWTPDDDSVFIDEQTSFFSETRLYYLELNRAVPPDTWVELIVWLDNLPYDPIYTYVTAVYFKNDAGFTGAYYLDDIALITLGE